MKTHSLKALNWSQVILAIVSLAFVALSSARPAEAQGTSTLVSAPNRADMVYDQGRRILYITSGSEVLRFSIDSQAFLTSFQLGGNLLGIDLSPDGNTLVVADGTYSNTQVWVYLVNLQTGISQKAAFPLTTTESWGAWSVAFGRDGNILITESNQRSPLRKFNPATGATTILLSSISGATALNSSADGSVIGFAQGDNTSGPWGWYRVSDGNLAQQQTGTYNLNYELATNRNGSQFAIPTFTGTFIYNSSLSNIATLWQPPAGSLQPQGAVYDPSKDILYLSWGGTQEVRAFETTNFTQVATMNFGATFQHIGMSQTYETGRLKVSRDGSLLFAIVDGGVRYVRLVPDTTPPILVPAVSPAPNTNGWNNTDVTVSWNVSDPESGISSSTGCETQTLTNETPGTALTCSATNGAGLSVSQTATVRIDKTPPTFTCAPTTLPNANGWYNSDVLVAPNTYSDALSGIEALAAATLSNEGAGQSATCVAIDKAGNQAISTAGNINIDKTKPSITIVSPQAKDYLHSNTIKATWTTTDGLSGVAANSGKIDGKAVTNGEAIDLFYLSLGSHTFTVDAADKAGNAASASVAFNVVADINSLIGAKERACSLGWIKGKGVCTLLDATLIAAKAAIGHNKPQIAKQLLNAFIKELDGQKGKAVNQRAYDLLKADALYVISSLH